jgi:sugar lactone lactonase YvrE
MVTTLKTFDTPCEMPNGLQWTVDGLYVMDQLTDNVYVLDHKGKLVRTIHTPTENGSGITVGGGYIWTASNGRTRSRPYRSTDTHLGYIFKIDVKTGETVDRFRTPDGGGLHGLEWDNGLIWITQFSPKALVLVDPKKDYRVVRKFDVDLPRAHGLARDGAGIWCAFTGIRTIVKYNIETGKEMQRIELAKDAPYPHGLSIKDGELWYCDADFPKDGGTSRGWPEIGKIVIGGASGKSSRGRR